MCQSVAQPSTAEYWHIGDTTIRLGSTSLRSLKGENRVLDIVMRRRARALWPPRFAWSTADRVVAIFSFARFASRRLRVYQHGKLELAPAHRAHYRTRSYK